MPSDADHAPIAKPQGKEAHSIAILALVVSVFSFAASALTVYLQFYSTNHSSSAAVTHIEWSAGQGRLGRGAKLGIVLGVFNTGNRAVVISRLGAKFSTTPAAADSRCSDPQLSWATLPWGIRWDGGNQNEAIALVVSPGAIAANYFDFMPMPVTPQEAEESKRFVCLQVELLDSRGRIHEVRSELGTLTYTHDRIVDWTPAPTARRVFTLIP